MRLSEIAISERAFDYLNNIAKKQKRRFLLFHSIRQRFALWEEGEFAPLYIMRAPVKGRKERRNRCRADYPSASNGVALKLTENRRRQLAEVFVNTFLFFQLLIQHIIRKAARLFEHSPCDLSRFVVFDESCHIPLPRHRRNRSMRKSPADYL